MSNPEGSDWIAVAALVRPRGIKGEMTAVSLSSRPERFELLKKVRLFGDGSEYEVERVWFHGDVPIFKIRGVDSMNDAERLRGAEVRVHPSERIALEAGEFYQSDLVGCEVRDAKSGRVIGVVTSLEEYGGPSLLSVDNGRILIPFVKAICVDIRPHDRVVQVELPEGLEDLDRR